MPPWARASVSVVSSRAAFSFFTVASVLCALSPSLPWLVAARFIQGLGGAAVMALGIALMRFTYPQRLLGAVIGWNATVIALSAAAGPTIGATILMVAGWPWLFAINLPVGAIVLAAALALPQPSGTGRRLDLLSVTLNGTAFAAFVLGIDFATNRPKLAAALLATAVASLIALVRREMPRHAPLIPLDLLRNGPFRISVIASVCCFAGQMASYVALPFYLQHGLGEDAFTTGLYLTPWPLTVAFAGPISGRLADRISNDLLCALGGIFLALGLALTALWPVRGNLLPLVIFFMLSGLGFGFFQTPNNRNMLLSVPPRAQRRGRRHAGHGPAPWSDRGRGDHDLALHPDLVGRRTPDRPRGVCASRPHRRTRQRVADHHGTAPFRSGNILIHAVPPRGMNQRRSASSNPSTLCSASAQATQASGRISIEGPVSTITHRILCVEAAMSLEAAPSVEASRRTPPPSCMTS